MLSLESMLLLLVVFLLAVILAKIEEVQNADKEFGKRDTDVRDSADNPVLASSDSIRSSAAVPSILDIFKDQSSVSKIEAFRILAAEKERRRISK